MARSSRLATDTPRPTEDLGSLLMRSSRLRLLGSLLLKRLLGMPESYDQLFSGPLVRVDALAPDLAAIPANGAAHSIASLKVMSWNLLAPPYVRPEREADARAMARAERQIALVAQHNPDVVGLQEFWHASESFVGLWRDFAYRHGYVLHVAPRVDGKRDGCVLLVRAACLSRAPTFECFTYNDWGSRVLQVAKLHIVGGSVPLTLMQTHLTFPHDSAHDPPMRRHQARKIAELTRVATGPTLVFGDLNTADEADEALSVLTSLGGLRPMPPSTTVGDQWVSHLAHTGAWFACDRFLTRGELTVKDWQLVGSADNLALSEARLSDHLPVLADCALGDAVRELPTDQRDDELTAGMH